MKYNLIIIVFFVTNLLQCCYCAQSKEEIQNGGWEMTPPILSSLSSNPVLVEKFRCRYCIRYGYAATADEAEHEGQMIKWIGEFHAVWNKDETNELLDIREVTVNDTGNNNWNGLSYCLGYNYCFLTNKKMAITFNQTISQGSISTMEYVKNPGDSLPLTPDSYLYIQDITDYLKEGMYKKENRTLFEQENNLIKVSIEGKTPLHQLFLNPHYGYLPRKFVDSLGDCVHIFDYYSLDNNKFFPKKVMEIQSDYDQNGILDRRQVRVREYDVTFFEPNPELQSSDFEFVSPQDVRIYDAKNIEASQGYTLRENTKLSANDLDTFYRLVLDSDKKQIDPVQHTLYTLFSGFLLRVFLVIIGIFCIILGTFLNRRYKKY